MSGDTDKPDQKLSFDFSLNDNEIKKFNKFKTALEEVLSAKLGLADFEFIFKPTSMGVAVLVKHKDFTKNITDYGSW